MARRKRGLSSKIWRSQVTSLKISILLFIAGGELLEIVRMLRPDNYLGRFLDFHLSVFLRLLCRDLFLELSLDQLHNKFISSNHPLSCFYESSCASKRQITKIHSPVHNSRFRRLRKNIPCRRRQLQCAKCHQSVYLKERYNIRL